MMKIKSWVDAILLFFDRMNRNVKAKIDERVEEKKRAFYLQHHIDMTNEEIKQYRSKLLFEHVGIFCLFLLLLFMLGGTII